MILEMGKNRVEALGEIEETADLLAYYAGQMRENAGYVREMGRLAPTDRNVSVLRPYGVWAVIAPWNFPYALLGAPVAAALVAGNTVVCKPSSETPLSGVKLAEIFHAAGVPPEALTCLPGSGRVIGDGLVEHPDVAGVTFTGSYDVGFKRLYQRFAGEFPKPAIVEMGGKNPALVMPSADLAQAVQGIYRSAFGMNGHKCSACSRVYVHRAVADELLAGLVQGRRRGRPGDPLAKGTFVGPVATKQSYEDYQRYVALARQARRRGQGRRRRAHRRRARARLLRPPDGPGRPAAATTSCCATSCSSPSSPSQAVDSLDEALARANDTKFGLTAGFFSREQKEIDTFFERIEAGVVYVNRAAGRDHRRLAGRAAVRRLEGERLDGEEHRRPLHGPLLPARAEPDGVPVSAARDRARRARRAGGAADQDRHRAARAQGPGDDRARPPPPVAVADSLLPADGQARVGLHGRGRRRQRLPRRRGRRGDGLDRTLPPGGGGGDRRAGRGADPHLRHRLSLPGLRRDLRAAGRAGRSGSAPTPTTGRPS